MGNKHMNTYNDNTNNDTKISILPYRKALWVDHAESSYLFGN